jgi:hypothetical protein
MDVANAAPDEPAGESSARGTSRRGDGGARVAASDAGAGARRTAESFAVGFVASASGPAMVDSTDRLAQDDGTGRVVRPGSDVARNAPAQVRQLLFPGDEVETGDGGSAELQIAGGTTLALGPLAHVLVPTFGRSALLVGRGAVRIRAPIRPDGAPLRVDTPAARLELSHGAAWAVVAEDGTVLLAAVDAPADVLAPSAALRAASVAPRSPNGASAAADAGVDAGAPPLAEARALLRTTVAPGRAVVLDTSGRARPQLLRAIDEAAVTAWRARAEHDIARPGGHHVPITQMSRAGGADLSDARAALARLRALGSAVTGALGRLGPGGAGVGDAIRDVEQLADDRATLEAQLSAALGRAGARADRARALAARGGDVSALQTLAHLEEVLDEARAVLPVRAPAP